MSGNIDVVFTPKRSKEVELFSVNFVNLLPAGETIQTAVVTPSASNGATRGISSMIVGAPNINGTIVSQQIGGGINGTTYELLFAIDTQSGLHIEVVGQLAVRD